MRVVAFAAWLGAASAYLVETPQGRVRGRRTGAAAEFYGIPYASPPVDALRFAPPVDNSTAPYADVLDASRVTACMQASGGDEDCLYLNVHVPVASSSRKAVLVFVHGGGLFSGSGAGLNGSTLAVDRDVVVVTINYRLGAFGLLALNDSDDGAGNMAYLDQRSALRWVRNNVEAFGGDADRVLLFGQSAGASSICVQLSLGARGLFSGALMESPFYCDAAYDLEAGLAAAAALARGLNCTSPSADACFRAASAADLATVGGALGPAGLPHPLVDGVRVPAAPMAALAETPASVPVVLGSNSDEGTFFVYGHGSTPLDAAAFEAALDALLLNETFKDEARALYPSVAGDNRPALARAMTHRNIQCAARRVAKLTSRAQPTFLYHFDGTDECEFDVATYGVPHCAELPYVFGSWGCPKMPTAGEQALSDAVTAAWARFAKTGDVGASWPTAFDPASGETRELLLDAADSGTIEAARDAAFCDFWDRNV